MTYMLNPTATTSATISVTGGAGSILTTSGTNGVSWYDNSSITSGGADLKPASLEVHGQAKFKHDVRIDGDLEIKGKSIAESLTKIEERLAIMQPNPKLEAKWAKLKELGDQYRELEADILEKEEIMRILKS